MKTKKQRGVVIYRGPSMIDGNPIVAIATLRTENMKTGDMIQTWILREDQSPLEAINSGEDYSICGDCSLRGIVEKVAKDYRNRQRACYVQVRNAPYQVWRAYQAGRYDDLVVPRDLHLFEGRKLRLGSYGEPVAIPYRVWKPLVDVASGHTGYSHQWRDGRFWRFRRLLMASVETIDDANLARAKGWRYFRTIPPSDTKRYANGQPVPRTLAGEILCPASEEAGKTRTCATCLACDGSNGNPSKVSVAIVAHGGPATLSNYRRLAG